jgi:hypothetical protein
VTRSIGRVSHPGAQEANVVEHSGPDVDELERIGRQMEAIEREQQGLVEAIRHARTRSFSWARIGVILGTSRQAAQQRFGFIDDELRNRGTEVPNEPVVKTQPPVNMTAIDLSPLPPLATPQPQFDFSAMASLSNDEIIALAAQLPQGTKLYDPYLRALREAIVVTLYKRNMPQRRISKVIGTSSQRVSQILAGFYDRVEQEWAAERAGWKKKGEST